MQASNGLDFDESMRAARRGDGEEIVFTRQERAILLQLTRKPGTLFTRHELHRALADTGRQTSERNVDFLVARLRTRLGDNARAPRFIATQYGEGYVWIAQTERRLQLRAVLAILTHLFHTSARHFRQARHRANVVRGPAYHFRRLLGPEAIPDEVVQLLVDSARQRGKRPGGW